MRPFLLSFLVCCPTFNHWKQLKRFTTAGFSRFVAHVACNSKEFQKPMLGGCVYYLLLPNMAFYKCLKK